MSERCYWLCYAARQVPLLVLCLILLLFYLFFFYHRSSQRPEIIIPRNMSLLPQQKNINIQQKRKHEKSNNYHYKSTMHTLKFDQATRANREDPDQAAPKGAAWSGSALFPQPLYLTYRTNRLAQICWWIRQPNTEIVDMSKCLWHTQRSKNSCFS